VQGTTGGGKMGQTETRHTEKANLFQVLKAEYENNFPAAVASLKASMEPEDVEEVVKLFEDYKKQIRK
jgi:hypothetical protein